MLIAIIVAIYWSRKAKKLGLEGSKYGGRAFLIYFLNSVVFGIISFASGIPALGLLGIIIGLLITGANMSKQLEEKKHTIAENDDSILDSSLLGDSEQSLGEDGKPILYTTDLVLKDVESDTYRYKYVEELTDEMKKHNESV